MPICVRYLLPGLLAALLPNPWLLPAALAQKADSPLFLPTTDVAVTYRYDGEMTGGVRMMQITYAEKGERVRINYFRWAEAKYPFLGLIFDRPANRLISVQPERKAYIDRQIGDTSNPGKLLPPDVQFIRQGISVVAHAPCTDWKLALRDKPNEDSTACVTEDGIVLRLATTKPMIRSLTATSIHYGDLPDGVFDPPAGFKRETVP